jgi:hypothetical protein
MILPTLKSHHSIVIVFKAPNSSSIADCQPIPAIFRMCTFPPSNYQDVLFMLEQSPTKASVHIQLPCGCFIALGTTEICPHGGKEANLDG